MVFGINNMMNRRFSWKFLFFIMIFSSGLSFYDSATLPNDLLPAHPSWLALIGIFFEFFSLLASFCVAFKVVSIKNKFFWYVILIGYVITNIMFYFYEFSAGGYSQTDMVDQGMIGVVIIIIFVSPIIKYIADVKNEK